MSQVIIQFNGKFVDSLCVGGNRVFAEFDYNFAFRDTNTILDATNMTNGYACSHHGPMSTTVTEFPHLSAKDNVTCGQSPIAVLLSLFDSVFFFLPVYLAPKWIPQLFRYPKCHKQGLNSTLANKYMVFNTWYWFSGNKNKNKNNKKLVIGHKGEKRKERPSTHLP